MKNPGKLHDRLVPHALGQGKSLRAGIFRIEDSLEPAFPVGEIDKDHAPHVPFGLDPARCDSRASDILLGEQSAVVFSSHSLTPDSRHLARVP